MNKEYIIVGVPHQGRPEVSHVFDSKEEVIDALLDHWVDDDYKGSNRNFDDALDRAGRDYSSFNVMTKAEVIDRIKSNNTQGHKGVELLTELKNVTYNHWHDEACEEFIDGFKETYGSETRSDAEKDWGDWSNNIQGGADSLGFEAELQGYASGKVHGEMCKQMKEEAV